MKIIFDTQHHFDANIYDIENLLTLLQRATLTAATWTDQQKRYLPVATADLRHQWAALSRLDTDSTAHIDNEIVRRAWYTPYIVRDQAIAAVINTGWHYKDKSYRHIYWYLNIGLNYIGGDPLPALTTHLRNTLQEMLS
jgi:hypothetical protein